MGETHTRRRRLLALLPVLALAGAACTTSDAGETDGLSGTIDGDGSSTVFPISQAVAEEFLVAQPNVQVPIGVSGTGGGFERFCNGETDFSDASRPIAEDEAAACADAGVEYIELQVAIDGLTVVVNLENDWADCLTVEELNTIWGPEAEGEITNWSQVRDGFPNEPLELFGPGTDSGTFDYFTDAINGEEGEQRTDYGNIGEDDNQAVRGVEGNLGGMGYFGYAFYINNTDRVKAIAVDGGAGCVEPTDETVAAFEYDPLSRPIFVYVRTDSLQRPEVAAFFQFYLDVVNDIIGDVGYVGMEDALLAEQVATLNAAIA